MRRECLDPTELESLLEAEEASTRMTSLGDDIVDRKASVSCTGASTWYKLCMLCAMH